MTVVAKKDREKYAPVYREKFKQVFGVLGKTHKARAEAMGTSFTAMADRFHGRSLPSQFERVMLCVLINAFGDDEKAMKKALMAGIEEIRAIEGREAE